MSYTYHMSRVLVEYIIGYITQINCYFTAFNAHYTEIILTSQPCARCHVTITQLDAQNSTRESRHSRRASKNTWADPVLVCREYHLISK